MFMFMCELGSIKIFLIDGLFLKLMFMVYYIDEKCCRKLYIN